MTTQRVPPPRRGSEREILAGTLDYLRTAVVRKAEGLSEEQARQAPVPPSTMTPAGVVKHLAGTERFWFSIDFAGLDLPHPWPEHDLHGAWELADDDTLDALLAAYRAECARSDAAVGTYEMGDAARGPGLDFLLRYAYAHMIQETARHAGHLDLLREVIDGTRGQ